MRSLRYEGECFSDLLLYGAAAAAAAAAVARMRMLLHFSIKLLYDIRMHCK